MQISPQRLADYLAGKLAAVEMDQVEEYLLLHPEVISEIPISSEDPLEEYVRQSSHDTTVNTEWGVYVIPRLMMALQDSAPAVPIPDVLLNHSRYQIQRLLGQGGMGAVFLAEHTLMHRPVALKVIKPQLVANRQICERFHREISAAAQLNHPNVVTAYDADCVGDVHFLIMEYVSGETTKDYLRRNGPLQIPDACRIIYQAALGLQHAHERGMIHRDIKPHNLMRTSAGTIKILDFGLAVLRDTDFPISAPSDETATLSGTDSIDLRCSRENLASQLTGTPDYMAPEMTQVTSTVDIRSDIYSLGCTLHQLLTGRPPYFGTNTAEILEAHRRQSVPSVRGKRPDVSDALEQVLQQMLAKNPAERFPTPADVATALLPFLDERRPIWRRLSIIPIASMVALLLAVSWFAATAIGRLRNLAGDDQSVASAISTTARKPPVKVFPRVIESAIDLNSYARPLRVVRQHEWAKHHAYITTFSPDGRLYAATGADYPKYGDDGLRVWTTMTGEEVLRIPGSGSMAFSPDSRMLFSASTDRTGIDGWDIQSKQVVCQFKARNRQFLLWSVTTDGQTLVTCGLDQVLGFWDISTGKELRSIKLSDSMPLFRISEDGKSIFVFDHSNLVNTVRRMDLAKRETAQSWTLPGAGLLEHVAISRDAKEFITGQVHSRKLLFWQTNRETHVRELTLPQGDFSASAFTCDLQWMLFTMIDDPVVHLLNLETGQVIARGRLDHHHGSRGHHSFSPDGQYAVISSSEPSSVFLYEMPSEVRSQTDF